MTCPPPRSFASGWGSGGRSSQRFPYTTSVPSRPGRPRRDLSEGDQPRALSLVPAIAPTLAPGPSQPNPDQGVPPAMSNVSRLALRAQGVMRLGTRLVVVGGLVGTLAALTYFLTAAGADVTAALAADACPNAALRAVNNSSALPDCRAYEL